MLFDVILGLLRALIAAWESDSIFMYLISSSCGLAKAYCHAWPMASISAWNTVDMSGMCIDSACILLFCDRLQIQHQLHDRFCCRLCILLFLPKMLSLKGHFNQFHPSTYFCRFPKKETWIPLLFLTPFIILSVPFYFILPTYLAGLLVSHAAAV